jgi:hypothetical protein
MNACLSGIFARFDVTQSKWKNNHPILEFLNKQTNKHNQLIFALFLSSLLSRQTPHSSIQTCTPRSTNTYYMAQNRNYHQSKHSKFFEEHPICWVIWWLVLSPPLSPTTDKVWNISYVCSLRRTFSFLFVILFPTNIKDGSCSWTRTRKL